METVEALSAQRLAQALRALRQEWQQYNWSLFGSRLREPGFGLTESRSVLARWVGERRLLEFSTEALASKPWVALVEVLKHEMAHQYVQEYLRVTEETAHGPAFRQVCAERGLDARAAGDPEVPTGERAAVLDKVARLLALAQSPNEHEAQAAMNAAQRLMLKHNLEHLRDLASRPVGVVPYAVCHVGEPSGRVEASIQMIGTILNEHFFVQVLWVPVWVAREGKRASVLELTGTPDNLAMARYVYSFLHHTAEGLWVLHKRAHAIKGDRDRRAFRMGVMLGFREKLERERAGNQERGLLWVGDPALEEFYRRRNPRLRTVQRTSSGNREARESGREAGRALVLHKGVSAGSSGGVAGLLGAGSRGR